jgi:hypothetical protein
MQTSTLTFASLVNTFADLANSVILLLSGIALLVFLWGCTKFIFESSSSEGHGRGKDMIIWGLVALFVLFSLGGILRFMREAVFPNVQSDFGDPNLPGGNIPFPPGPGDSLNA